MIRLIPFLFLAIILAGCGHREAAKAAEQARQADAAVAADMVKALAESLDLATWQARVRVWLDLIQQSERSTAVVVAALSPDGPPRVTTSEQTALAQPAQFIAEAQKQVGRAEAENAEKAAWNNAAGLLATYATALVGGNWMTVLLTAISGAGGAGALILGALKTVNAIRTRDQALVEAVKTGDELAEATTPEAVQQVKDAAEIRQQVTGTKSLIKKALAQV